MNAKGSRTTVGQGKSETVAALPRACSDELAAVEFIEHARWEGSPACPHCGDVAVYQMKDRKTGERSKRFLWRCRGCKRQFTVRVGTIMQDSLIPLRHWCFAFWAACASKKGVSALQIRRQTGLSYKSALFLVHRIRWAMADGPMPGPLFGTVEVDETYVGGKPRLEHGSKGRKNPGGRGTKKTPVVALVERKGRVRASPVTDVTARTLQGAIFRNVHVSARIVTDEWAGYRGIGKHYEGGHATVNHGSGEYVRGDVYTNTAEGFFSILKRGINGVYHAVSKKHLHRYCSEFAFRYNARKVDDGARTVAAIKAGDGKRLTRKQYAAA